MKKSSKKLPKTDSIRALARFWDAHDLTDFENELVEIDEPVFVRAPRARSAPTRRSRRGGGEAGALSVPLKPREARTIERMAESKGLSPEDLVRLWVREKIAPRRNGRASSR